MIQVLLKEPKKKTQAIHSYIPLSFVVAEAVGGAAAFDALCKVYKISIKFTFVHCSAHTPHPGILYLSFNSK